jgi:hypothetical protein
MVDYFIAHDYLNLMVPTVQYLARTDYLTVKLYALVFGHAYKVLIAITRPVIC